MGVDKAAWRALAGEALAFLPDVALLFKDIARDERVPRRVKVEIGLAAGYLVMPFDLIPDFIPVAGQLDDAVVVVLTLRAILRAGGLEMIEEHWPGPRSSLSLILKLAGRAAKS